MTVQSKAKTHTHRWVLKGFEQFPGGELYIDKCVFCDSTRTTEFEDHGNGQGVRRVESVAEPSR